MSRLTRAALLRRLFSSSPSPPVVGPSSAAIPAGWRGRLVSSLNTTFKQHPQAAVVSLFLSDVASLSAVHSLFVASGVQFSAQFALAFALSRPLRRLRLPVELATAAGLSRVAPWLTQIQWTELSRVLPNALRPVSKRDDQDSRDRHEQRKKDSVLYRGVAAAQDAIDHYGAAYFLSVRLVGVSVVMSLYMALKYGVDVKPMFDYIGFNVDGSLGTTLGTWAGAVTAASVLYPVTIASTVVVAPALSKAGTAIAKLAAGQAKKSA